MLVMCYRVNILGGSSYIATYWSYQTGDWRHDEMDCSTCPWQMEKSRDCSWAFWSSECNRQGVQKWLLRLLSCNIHTVERQGWTTFYMGHNSSCFDEPHCKFRYVGYTNYWHYWKGHKKSTIDHSLWYNGYRVNFIFHIFEFSIAV